MTIKKIEQVIQLFEQSSLTEMDLEFEYIKLSLKKNSQLIRADNSPDSESIETRDFIVSPLVGTFYAASAPDAKPFVSIGDEVKVGDSLCVIEAMKVNNEIKSEVDGVIMDILVKNGKLVQFEQKLFEIKSND